MPMPLDSETLREYFDRSALKGMEDVYRTQVPALVEDREGQVFNVSIRTQPEDIVYGQEMVLTTAKGARTFEIVVPCRELSAAL